MARPVPVVNVWNGSSFTEYTPASVNIGNGKQRILDRMVGTRCTFTLDVASTASDPSATIVADAFVFIEAENSAAVGITQFAGRVDSAQIAYPGPNQAVMTVTCSGAHAQFASAPSDTFTISTNVEDTLDTLVAAAYGLVADGTFVVYTDPWGGRTGDSCTLTAADGTPASLAQAVVDGVLGDLVDRLSNDRTHPVFQFVARRRRFQNPVIVFTDVDADIDTANGVFPYDTTSWSSRPTNDLVRNIATVTRQGGSAQTVEDTVSSDITDGHGQRPYSLSSYHTSDAEALLCAGRVVWEYTEPPEVAIASITLEPETELNGADSDFWDFILNIGQESTSTDGLPLMRQVTVIRTGPFGTVERNCILTGYEHDIQPQARGGWRTTLFFADGHLLTGGDVTAFTAVLKQNGSTVASTTNDAQYVTSNGFTTAHLKLTSTAAGGGNEIKVTPTSLPAPASSAAGECVGIYQYSDAGVFYDGPVDWDGTDLRLGRDGSGSRFGSSPPINVASGDILKLTICYRNA